MTCMIVLAFVQSLANPAVPQHEWVVREVIPGGVSPYIGFERRWLGASSPGDIDQDEKSDFILLYEDRPVSGALPWHGLFSVRNVCMIQDEFQRDRYGVGNFSYSGFSDDAILVSPFGPLKALNSHSSVWRLRTFQLSGSHIASAPREYQVVHQVPDIDGDGFDDMFVQTHTSPSIAALLDGRTMSERWTVFGGDPTGDCILSPFLLEQFVDFDRDGVRDFLSSVPVWSGSAIEAQIRALSGADGSLIWGRNEPGFSALIAGAIVPDVTGDGISDVAFTTAGVWTFPFAHFLVLDGATGAIIWSRHTNTLGVSSPESGYVLDDLDVPVFADAVPGSADRHHLVVLCVLKRIAGGQDIRRYLHLDLKAGSVMGWASEPTDLLPWYPDPFDSIYGVVRRVVGDVDRDGLNEIAVPCVAYSKDLLGSIVYYPWHLTIIGQRTLFQPSSARPGEHLDYRIAIPGAPDHDYLLLLSLGFDRDGGERVDGWKTHLVADAAFAATRAGRYSGRLDARGVGTQSATLPPNPALSGKTLYAKAVVWKPGSASEVWTMSSLGVTEIR